ncbi:hypothetical protein ACKVV1_011445 [Pyricularia oryzae]
MMPVALKLQHRFLAYPSLLAALEHTANNTKESILVYPLHDTTNPESAHRVSYRQLLRTAKSHARSLRAKIESLGGTIPQVTDGSPQPIVVIHFEHVLDTIEWYWAVLLWGGIPAITSRGFLGHDQADADAQLAHLGATLGASRCFCLTRRALMGPYLGQRGSQKLRAVAVEDLLSDSDGKIEESGSGYHTWRDNADHLGAQHDPDAIAAIMFTSGSSGNAKAVPITHQQILTACAGKDESAQLKFPDSPFLSWVNMDHVANLVHCHLFAIIAGVSQLHVHAADVTADPVQFLNILSRHRVSRTFAPNFLLAKLRRLVEAGRAPHLDPDLNLEALYLDTGGEANVVEVCVAVQEILSRYGAPDNVINPSFGMTETCAGCIFNSSCPGYDVGQDLEFASLGRPMPGVLVRIAAMDTDHGNGNSNTATSTSSIGTAGPGERGHLEVTGPAVFKGYFGNPEATKAAFTSDGWFRTGDLAYLDEAGNLHLKGRTKELININGVKYLPYELDSALDQAEIPGATPAHFCCFSTRDPGMDTEAVVVLYQPCTHPDFVDDEDAALFDTQERIGEVIALRTRSRPRVVGLDAGLMQKSTLAKLSRAKLQTAFERGEFAAQRSRHEAAVRRYRLKMRGEPADDREEALLELIREQLELRPEDDFAVNDSILSYGATSMDLMALKFRINNDRSGRLGLVRRVELLDLIRNPTARGLATRIQTLAAEADKRDGSTSSSYDPVVVLQPRGSKPPLWMVHPGVGEVLVFVALARHLTDRPLYAFRARGFEPGEKPFGSLRELVRVYHGAVKARQPRGPYAIAGYSFGGMVAFEVAKVLEADGDEVRLCAPFNLPPHIKWRMRELVWDECVMHLFYFVELMTEEGIYAHKEAICQRAYSDSPDGRLEAIRYIKPYCDQARWKDLGLGEKDYLHWVNIASSMQALAVDYEPSGSVRSMDVFVADPLSHVAKNREDWINGRLSAWKDFVKGGDVRFHNVDGAHYTMLNPKFVNVSSFAEKLRSVLAERGM